MGGKVERIGGERKEGKGEKGQDPQIFWLRTARV